MAAAEKDQRINEIETELDRIAQARIALLHDIIRLARDVVAAIPQDPSE
jgi:hypothetical protein